MAHGVFFQLFLDGVFLEGGVGGKELCTIFYHAKFITSSGSPVRHPFYKIYYLLVSVVPMFLCSSSYSSPSSFHPCVSTCFVYKPSSLRSLPFVLHIYFLPSEDLVLFLLSSVLDIRAMTMTATMMMITMII